MADSVGKYYLVLITSVTENIHRINFSGPPDFIVAFIFTSKIACLSNPSSVIWQEYSPEFVKRGLSIVNWRSLFSNLTQNAV